MKRRDVLALAVVLFGFASQAFAADADPTGSWKWTMMGRNNQPREVTLKLKLEGDKLTGSMPGRDNTETAITDATFKDGQVSFSVTREFNGNKFTSKYNGKLDGSTIKGKIESTRNGETTSRDWEATKQ